MKLRYMLVGEEKTDPAWFGSRDIAKEKRHYSKPKATRGPPPDTILFTLADARAAMGIDWMNMHELSQAIPPAYTEWLGCQLLAALEADQ